VESFIRNQKEGDMKKNDLKQLIKPIVKECIHEALIEEGLLSNVVSEVVKGMQVAPLVENKSAPIAQEKAAAVKSEEARRKIAEHRHKMLEAIGTDAYNGVDLFEGTQPMAAEPPQGRADLGSPSDAGVDISSILGNASHVWRAMK
tara:strand:- start:118 stop:555 length:438 start_codon:yes stop_codon:yes gene_type:complete